MLGTLRGQTHRYATQQLRATIHKSNVICKMRAPRKKLNTLITDEVLSPMYKISLLYQLVVGKTANITSAQFGV